MSAELTWHRGTDGRLSEPTYVNSLTTSLVLPKWMEYMIRNWAISSRNDE